MTVLYVDYEGGNNNHSGSSFALIASGADGRISGSTFSSVGAAFPNDGSLIGQRLSIFNGTSYIIFDITAWVNPTSLTVAQIQGGTALGNQTVDRQYYIGGRWKDVLTAAAANRVAAGDEVRIMASPDPVSIGSAVWTTTPVAPRNAAIDIASITATTPIAVTTTNDHNLATGDTVALVNLATAHLALGVWEVTVTGPRTLTLDGSVGSTPLTNLGDLHKINNFRVMLDYEPTTVIASCSWANGAWQSADAVNVVSTIDTAIYKTTYGCVSLAIAAGFTTGLAAYFPTGPLNLSGYEQVSVWIRQVSGTASLDGELSLVLYSDAAGTVPVTTIPLPGVKAPSNWALFTVNVASPLGANIQSIGLVVNVDRGAQSFLLGGIFACKAASDPTCLTISDLIGKDDPTDNNMYYAIASIVGRRVLLDSAPNGVAYSVAAATGRNLGYKGTDGYLPTKKRTPIPVVRNASNVGVVHLLKDNTYIQPRTQWLGGWDRATMSIQNGETWFDSANASGATIYTQSDNQHFDKICGVRATNGYVDSSSSYNTIGTFKCCNTAGYSVSLSNVSYLQCGTIVSRQSSTAGGVTTANGAHNDWGAVDIKGGLYGFVMSNSTTNTIGELIADNCQTAAYYSTTGTNVVKSGTLNADLCLSGVPGHIGPDFDELHNVTFTPNTAIIGGMSSFGGSHFFRAVNYNKIPGDIRWFASSAQIQNDANITHGNAAFSWKLSPLNASYINSYNPVVFMLGTFALKANTTTNITVRMRRDNVGLSMKLLCRGGQIAGIASDVVSSMTAGANTWEDVTISLAPTETGIVRIEVNAYGGATYNGWVSDMVVSGGA